jgi:hypothetical protein
MLRLLLSSCPFGTQYGLVFSGRLAGRSVYAPLCDRAAPPPGVSPARGPRLAAPPLGPVGPARFSCSPSSTTVAVAAFTESLRYACVRRRRPGTTRLAARTSLLRMSGPWARLGSLVFVSSFAVGAVVFAPPRLRRGARRRRRAPARRAARAPITSLPGPCGPGSHSRRIPPISTPLFALAAGWAAATSSMLACDHRKGGDV